MKKYQKVSNHDLLFPLSFVYQDTKCPQKELSDHMHDYYEIVYVYSGNGTFFVGDVFYDMQQGDVFLIPNNTIHRAMPNKDDPVTSTIIFFSPTLIYKDIVDDSFSYLNLFDLTKKSKNYKISLPPKKQVKMEEQLLHIYQETSENALGARHATLLIVHQIMLDLCRIRINNEQDMSETNTYSSVWIKDILAYINDHLSEPLTLTILANKSLVSPSHFSRVFKETTGIGLIVYLNTKRVIKAKELLLETNHTVSHIAEMCGFESMPHFHRIFKKYNDRTPANFRKAHHKS
ncbi:MULTISPECIES: AraC family transcriptional regulator [unclassified Peribacillus]|uniref:AraC family transcriptional regulator n=1 Tax=unclassified Peribacillus TaxID=2675266 RepID=UPI001914913A|nr:MULTISPECIES: AraC family transcriptional regulator [unclassified Peribacillus]MBK5441981.1 helix-turn-helix domain-containing protein [Peribacillus sp. TH24]MBK5463244.1 helix-turn-helix domain-containing protein [Peribacillus sp. TH27]MBK5501487.1 helix-turn-helix domain-containing protein [Peribacillus sp. TH14]